MTVYRIKEVVDVPDSESPVLGPRCLVGGLRMLRPGFRMLGLGTVGGYIGPVGGVGLGGLLLRGAPINPMILQAIPPMILQAFPQLE